jgi:hypothetical protein
MPASISLNLHGVARVQAEAWNRGRGDGCLDLIFVGVDGLPQEISAFMPFALADRIANAINAAAEAPGTELVAAE